ncbi:MAG: tyrosine-type recombinase/integrase [Candidatus Micrarchaeota archaeon]
MSDGYVSKIERILDDKRLVKENRAALARFNNERSVSRAAGTRWLCLFTMKRLDEAIRKPFKKMTKRDLVAYWNRPDRARLKSNCERKSMKTFFQWLYKRPKGEYPSMVKWMELNKNGRKKLPEEILTPEEVKALISATKRTRDAAIAHVLYESGARVGELLALKLKHVEFDEYGAKLILSGKTGMRRARLIDSVPRLSQWINEHPLKNNPEAPLFVGKTSEKGISYRGVIARILKSAARRAGIKKRIYPHLFRHSRATYLAKDFTEQELKIIFGWTGGSEMPATYVHLSGADVDKKICEKQGVVKKDAPEEKENNLFKPRECYRCGTKNPADGKTCSSCHALLDPKLIAQKEEEEKKRIDELVKMQTIHEIKTLYEESLRAEIEALRKEIGELKLQRASF